MRPDQPDRSPDSTPVGVPVGTLVGLVIGTAVLFGFGVFVTEHAGEILVDVDLKPFFIPYLVAVLVPLGVPTFAVAMGAALGEGTIDVGEGYELDDPFGFFGYVFGILAFSYLLHAVAPDPDDWRWQTLAAVVGALVQALCEAMAFIVVEEATLAASALSVLGNTLSHGLVLGAVPLVVLYPLVADRAIPRLRGTGDAE